MRQRAILAQYFLFLLTLAVGPFFQGCGSSKGSSRETVIIAIPDSANVVVLRAKVVQIAFEDKGGRVHEEVQNFYLSYNDIEWFVKFSESQIKPDDLKPLIGSTVEFRLIERDGLWDTDDPTVQSRVGKYVAILEIVGR